MKSSLGGEVYAVGEMVDHMTLLKDFRGPSEGVNPDLSGLEGCEGLCTNLKTKKMIAEKLLVRRSMSIQQALGEGELENAYWFPGAENPAGGIAKVRGDVVPLLRLLESGCLSLGNPRPLKGAAWRE